MRIGQTNYHFAYCGVKEKPEAMISRIKKSNRARAKLAADCATVVMLRAVISLHDESDVEAFDFFLDHFGK